MKFWPEYLANAKPRLVTESQQDAEPVVVFIDGAEEDGDEGNEVSIGGILMNKWTKQAFGRKVPRRTVQIWKEEGQKEKVIHQAELAPALVALHTWKEELKGRKILLFIDNDAARHALVKGKSANAASYRILHQFWEFAAEHEMMIWIERVPTKSNPADGPSRDDWSWCLGQPGGNGMGALGLPISTTPIITYDITWVLHVCLAGRVCINKCVVDPCKGSCVFRHSSVCV